MSAMTTSLRAPAPAIIAEKKNRRNFFMRFEPGQVGAFAKSG
jgi:hypothetical protein